jgi:3-oxoacyl-(acyl-carrier-protein) synthase
VLGTTWGEALEVEHDLLRHDAPRDPFGRLSGDLRRGLDLPGCDFTVTTTCAAGNHAIAMASDLLRSGTVDRALAVGADALCYAVLLGFSRLLLQDPHGCRPFDLNRNGTVIGEGAAALVLERADAAAARGAEILAEVAGCGLSCDAAGPFASNTRDVRSLDVAARAALAQAGLDPGAIDHVSAHASGTRLNDAKETHFLKELLGPRAARVPVNGIKSMLGHAQGAAALLEAVASVLTLRHDVLFPTINLETPDPACDLDYVANRARPARVHAILSNAFGLGGTNAIVIFRRWEGS